MVHMTIGFFFEMMTIVIIGCLRCLHDVSMYLVD
jgi:hypothetical protein